MAQAFVSKRVKRGEKSWNYIYIALAFVLSFEGTFIQMITPLLWPYNVIAYVIVFVLTCWLFLSNGWFQNKLIGIKTKYEDTARSP